MFGNIFLMASLSIWRNLMRSILTMLGIVIGVASVCTLVTVGQGATAQVASDIGAMGENLLMIRPGTGHRPGAVQVSADAFKLTDIEAIRRQVPGVAHAASTTTAARTVVYKNQNTSTSIVGTSSDYVPCQNYELESGNNFTPAEDNGLLPRCILGATVKNDLFGKTQPLGQQIRIGRMPCTVVGLLKAKGKNTMGMDQDDVVLVPVRVFQRRVVGNNAVSSISVSVSDTRSTAIVKTEIEALLRERRRIGNNSEDDFEVNDLQEIVSTIQQTTGVLTALLGAIAAVSLLVGGIGIMNIMLVSVTERTREIGVRLAIGAFRGDIRLQFLVEAALLSGIGGVIGVAAGNAGAWLIANAMQVQFVPSISIAAIAMGFSLFVGIVFGLLPAHRAAMLDPMEALRYE